jgi:hypothetical protein
MRIDAYAHTGVPRFGSAEQGRAFLASAGIARIVFVLGPEVPDLEQIPLAHDALGDNVRTFGIPFGRDETQVEEITRVQIDAGVLGLRMEPRQVLAFPRAMALIGEASRWIYATNPASSESACRALSDWLESYPEGFVGAPHFLMPRVPQGALRRAVERLASHPRFFAIFSRHGGVGSDRPYPHEDLKEWVRFVLGLCGEGRVLWGSEFPVFMWRGERIDECLGWFSALMPDAGADAVEGFLGGNARRIIFSRPAPPRTRPEAPRWVEQQFDRGRTVPLFPRGLALPMPVYRAYLDRYLARVAREPNLLLDDVLREALAEAAKSLR